MLDLDLRPSWLLGGSLLALHLAALVALFQPLVIPPALKLVLGVTVVVSAITTLRRWALLQSPASLVRVRGHESEPWHITTRDGKEFQARVDARPFVTNTVVIVHLLCADQRLRRIIVARDSVGAENLRRLRRLLRGLHDFAPT